MAKEKSTRLTRLELEIMRSLWELKQASVREIQENLPEKKRPAYTTVQTIIRRLEEKDAVSRLKKIGYALIFEPKVSRKAAHGRLISDLLQMFGGSARPLMAHLVEMGKLSLEDVREVEAWMMEQQKEQSNTSDRKGDDYDSGSKMA
ncbi:MAG: BlaI/MecI/CopY family transcriptional regulator [Acidobacteriota bacterium]